MLYCSQQEERQESPKLCRKKRAMEYRNWSKNDIRTSLLGYGCMRFPTNADGSIDEPRAEALLNTAKAAGINYFDTAYPYHNGQSEPFVGRVIAKWERSSFYLATKMPLWTCKSLDDAKRIFEEQFQRLGVDYIDFYLLHSLHKARYEQAKDMGVVDWLWEQKAAGRIRNFGFSCHDNSAGFEYILKDQPWDFCQLQYNYLDRDDRAEEISGDRGYQLTEECGVPLIIMEPVKGGTLASLPADAAAPLHALRPDATDASWALRWVGSRKNVHVILSGMSAEDQLSDNLATFDHFEPLSPAENAAVENVADELHRRIKIGCTGCRYCMPCPMGVDIPDNFSIWNKLGMFGQKDAVKKQWKSPALCPLRQVRSRLPAEAAHPRFAGKAPKRAGRPVTTKAPASDHAGASLFYVFYQRRITLMTPSALSRASSR